MLIMHRLSADTTEISRQQGFVFTNGILGNGTFEHQLPVEGSARADPQGSRAIARRRARQVPCRDRAAARSQDVRRGHPGDGAGDQGLPRRHRPALRAGDAQREARSRRRDGAPAAPRDRVEARSSARLQRARLLARRTQDPPARSARADPEGARAQPRRAVDHRQHGLGRIPPGQSRGGDPPAAPRVPGAARSGDRRPSRRSAVERRPDRGSSARLSRCAHARRAERRPARNAGAPARRPVTRRGAMPRPRFESLRSRGVVLAFTLLAAACTTVPPALPSEASEVLSGRLALRVEPVANEAPRSVSAAFDLRGDSRAGTLGLSTPLGSMLAQARWSPAEVVLTTPRETRRFASLDALTREALGESVPIEAWFDWLRGRPWPGAPHAAEPRRPGIDSRGGGLSPARLARRPVAVRRRHDRGGARSARADRDGANPPRRSLTR